MRNLSVAALSILLLGAVSGPVLALDLVFERTWGGPSLAGPTEEAEGVAVAPDGSIYVTGQTSSFGTGADDGDSDIFLIKYAPDGTIAWQRTYGVDRPDPLQPANDFGMDVEVAPDGSVWVTGELAARVLLVQFDASGNLLSERTFDGADSPRAMDIAPDGSIYVTGFEFPGAGQGDAFLMKCAPDGTLVWLKTWGAVNGFDIGFDVAAASDGSVYIAGDSNGFFGNGAFLLKVDAGGNVIWERTWRAGTIQDFSSGQGVAIGPDGNIYLTGSALISGVGQNAFLVKFAPDGSVLWERVWLERDSTGATGIAVAPGGRIYITGGTSFGIEEADAFVVEFLPDGQVRRAATWGGAGAQFAQDLALAPDGSLYVAGGTTGPPPYKFRQASKKQGTPVSFLGTPTGTVTTPPGTATDPNGIVLVPNGSQTYAGGTDAVLLKIVP